MSYFLLQMTGLATLAGGIWFLVDPSILDYLNIADLGRHGVLGTTIAAVTITIGGLMTTVCFYGLFGACCNNQCMLYTVRNMSTHISALSLVLIFKSLFIRY